jgi:hypothetical protein
MKQLLTTLIVLLTSAASAETAKEPECNGRPSVLLTGALIDASTGIATCPGGEFVVQIYDRDSPDGSVKIGGIETQPPRIDISCIRKR